MGGRVGWGGACRAGDTPVISSRYYNCHFEPKARNLAFPSPAVLRDRSGAVETANCFGSRDSLYSKSVLLAPYPLLSPDSGGASARRCSGQEDKRLRQPSRPLSCPPRGAPLPNWGRGGGVGAGEADSNAAARETDSEESASGRCDAHREVPLSPMGRGGGRPAPENRKICWGPQCRP